MTETTYTLDPEETGMNSGFGAVAWEWLDFQRSRLKLSSIARYADILNSYLVPGFGERRIAEIRRQEVRDFCCGLLQNGGADAQGLSPATVSAVLSEMKSIFHFASREKGLQVADIGGIPIRQRRNPLRVLNAEEQRKLETYLLGEKSPCTKGILLCLYTGMRLGEVCALKWEDISADGRTLLVCKTMQRIHFPGEDGTRIIVSTPKSECSVRQIPIPEELSRLLSSWRKPEGCYLLTGASDHYMEPRAVQYRFKSILRACGIEDANFHALRHTFATRCVEVGFDVKTLSEILGHSTVSMTMNRYIHPTMEQKRKNMNLLHGLQLQETAI